MATLPLVSQTDLEEKTMAVNVQTTNLNTSWYDLGMTHLPPPPPPLLPPHFNKKTKKNKKKLQI